MVTENENLKSINDNVGCVCCLLIGGILWFAYGLDKIIKSLERIEAQQKLEKGK